MGKSPHDNWVARYDASRDTYAAFAERLAEIIESMLSQYGVRFYAIEHRAKDVASLKDKHERKGAHYSGLEDISDLAGVRIILSDIGEVAPTEALCRSMFDVVSEESGDAAQRLSVGEFGYQSVHLVLRLARVRTILPEWSQYVGMKGELQIRTVLQHAWASVSHALDYKREDDVPAPLRRRLFRIAGLLEVADAEFGAVRTAHEILDGADGLAQSVPRPPTRSEITGIETWLECSDYVARLALDAAAGGFEVVDDSNSYARADLHRLCQLLHPETFGSLTDELAGAVPSRKAYFDQLLVGSGRWSVSPTFLVMLEMVFCHGEVLSVQRLTEELGWREDIAQRVLTAVNEAKARMPG